MTTHKNEARRFVGARYRLWRRRNARPIAVTRAYTAKCRTWWFGLSHFKRHWALNVCIGIAIEIAIHFAGHSLHLSPVLAAENWGLDQVTRFNRYVCDTPADRNLGWVAQGLGCPTLTGGNAPPVLIEVDDKTWRSAEWGGGEPPQAPRPQLAKLVERAFDSGAAQVVVDVLIEDSLSARAADAKSPAQDQEFADRMRAIFTDAFSKGHRLILVRTERAPLADDAKFKKNKTDEDGDPVYLGEIRGSRAVDDVVKVAKGGIVVAAPYFVVGADRRVRDWELFKPVCDRATAQLRIVPSVQLAASLFKHAVRCDDVGEALGFCGAPKQVAAQADDFLSCVPFPASGPAYLTEKQQSVHACNLAAKLHGVHEFVLNEACKAAKDACDKEPKSSPSVVCASYSALRSVKSKGGPLRDHGILQAYWTAIRPALERTGVHLPDMPHEGAIQNRVIFRYTHEEVLAINAGEFLSAKPDTNEYKRYRQLLDGRIVVIGQTYPEASDSHITPLGRMAGALVLVNAIDSMDRHQLMRTPSGVVTWTIALALIVPIGALFAWLTSALAAFTAAVLVVVTAGVGSFFWFGHGVWLNFAAPLIGILIHNQLDAHKERKELKRLRAQAAGGQH